MFEFNIELDPYSLELGIDGYSLGDITIKGKYGLLSSNRDIGSNQSMMIFLSISLLLDGILSLIVENKKQYKFEGIDCSFSFLIENKKETLLIKDFKQNIIAQSTPIEFIKSIWKTVNKFVTKYRAYLEESDGVTIDLDISMNDFKTQFSEYLE